MTAPTIDTLLRLVPDSPSTVLTHLTTHPHLASAQDSSGYSLLHAASSYAQLDLARTLVHSYTVSPSITDLDGETPLFAAETVAAARCLVEELGADVQVVNEEGVSALESAKENVEDGGEWADVVAYLASVKPGPSASKTDETTSNGELGAEASGHAPPPLPPGVRITGMRAVPEQEQEGQEAPLLDPGFRRRIEELAAREDFQGEEGQKELKRLVEDAVDGLQHGSVEDREVRRRVGS